MASICFLVGDAIDAYARPSDPHTYALTYFAVLLVCLGQLVLTVAMKY